MPIRSFLTSRSFVAVVAALGVVVSTGVRVADAEWDQTYESAEPVDSSGFIDIVATADGGALILGRHSGDFESLSAGFEYVPLVQYRDPSGMVVWTETVVIDETCTLIEPEPGERGLAAEGAVMFSLATCSGDHLVTADVDGIIAVRSFERADFDPDDEPDAADFFFLADADVTGGAQLLSAESRVVDGGSNDVVLTQFDRDLAVESMTSLTAEFPTSDQFAGGPFELSVDSTGAALIAATTPPPLAHLDGENVVVRVSPDGADVTRTVIGADECGEARVIRAEDEVWILSCTESPDPDPFGELREYRLDVFAPGDLSTATASYVIETSGFENELVSTLMFGSAEFSTDGSLLRSSFDRYFRVEDADPNLWTSVDSPGEVVFDEDRSVRSFDAIGNEVVEVGVVSAADFFFDDDFLVEQLVDPPRAFIERAALPSLAAIDPVRFVDTRSGGVTVDGAEASDGRAIAGSVAEFQIAGRGSVPSDAVAVFVNVTAVRPGANGFLTAFPCDADRPDASSLNYQRQSASGNHVLAALDSAGNLCVFTSATTDLVIDVGGFYGAGDELGSLAPARLLDTRPNGATIDGRAQGGGARNANVEVVVPAVGRADVPADATAVYVNLSAFNSTTEGFAVAYPCGGVVPGTSAINFAAQGVANNLALVELGDEGSFCIQTSQPTQLTADVAGWVGNSSSLDTSVQYRALESRLFIEEFDPDFPPDDPDCCRLEPGEIQSFEIFNPFSGATADVAIVNVTAIGPLGDGFVSMFPCDFDAEDSGRSGTSVLNFSAGVTSGNTAIVGSGGPFDGQICVEASVSTHLVVDVLAAAGTSENFDF